MFGTLAIRCAMKILVMQLWWISFFSGLEMFFPTSLEGYTSMIYYVCISVFQISMSVWNRGISVMVAGVQIQRVVTSVHVCQAMRQHLIDQDVSVSVVEIFLWIFWKLWLKIKKREFLLAFTGMIGTRLCNPYLTENRSNFPMCKGPVSKETVSFLLNPAILLSDQHYAKPVTNMSIQYSMQCIHLSDYYFAS